MLVKMKKTIKGAEDGIRVKLYEEGQICNLKESGFLYDPWIENGTCEDFVEVDQPTEPEEVQELGEGAEVEPETAAFETVAQKQKATRKGGKK